MAQRSGLNIRTALFISRNPRSDCAQSHVCNVYSPWVQSQESIQPCHTHVHTRTQTFTSSKYVSTPPLLFFLYIPSRTDFSGWEGIRRRWFLGRREAKVSLSWGKGESPSTRISRVHKSRLISIRQVFLTHGPKRSFSRVYARTCFITRVFRAHPVTLCPTHPRLVNQQRVLLLCLMRPRLRGVYSRFCSGSKDQSRVIPYGAWAPEVVAPLEQVSDTCMYLHLTLPNSYSNLCAGRSIN